MRPLKLVVLGLSVVALGSSVQASSVHNVHNNRSGFIWFDSGYTSVNGMMWYHGEKDEHHSHKKHKNNDADDVQKEDDTDPNQNLNTDIDLVDNHETTVTGNNNPPTFLNNDDPGTNGAHDLFNDNLDNNTNGPSCRPPCDTDPKCNAVPLPPAAWAGLATMIGAGWSMRRRLLPAKV
jgi:hypothetical protein